jgi:hypothetical protein
LIERQDSGERAGSLEEKILKDADKLWRFSPIGFWKDFLAILEERIIPSYPVLENKIENHKTVFSEEGDQITLGLREARIFERFIPREFGGQFGAIALTEEKAGSDASAIGFSARRIDGQYLLNGEKMFISNSGLADIYATLVNTRGTKGSRSLSILIVENGTAGGFTSPASAVDWLTGFFAKSIITPAPEAIRPSPDQQPGYRLPDRRPVLQNERRPGTVFPRPGAGGLAPLPAELFPGQALRHPNGYGSGRPGPDYHGR